MIKPKRELKRMGEYFILSAVDAEESRRRALLLGIWVVRIYNWIFPSSTIRILETSFDGE